MNKTQSILWWSSTACRVAVAGCAIVLCNAGAAFADDTARPPGRTIAYAIEEYDWARHETKDGKEECPNGLNQFGPREQFKILYPEDGSKRTVANTQLQYESDIWFPREDPDQFVYQLAGGKVAPGLNLDGKVKPTDFLSPTGVPGVDNQLYRVLGCQLNYRNEGVLRKYLNDFHRKKQFNRLLIELTDVDSLVNDDDVTITIYRGRDPLLEDATGKGRFLPGATERLDTQWSNPLIHSAKGKIVDGVFISTQPMDFMTPRMITVDTAIYWMRDARFELKLTPQRAEGIVGGYFDVETFYYSRSRSESTHHHSYGQQAQASIYRQLIRLADGFPDPKTGKNTAISGAYVMQLIQVYVEHPAKQVADLR